jgi:hypothetical protein
MGTQISDETSRLKSFTDYMSSRFKEKRLSKKSRVDLPPPTSGEYADYRFLSHFLGVDKLQQKWEARQEKLARRKKIKEALPAIIGGTIAIIAGLALIAGAIFGITLAVKSAAESQERARAEASQSAQATPSPTKTTSSPTPSPTPSKSPSSSPSPSKSSSDSNNNSGSPNRLKNIIMTLLMVMGPLLLMPIVFQAIKSGNMKGALGGILVIVIIGAVLMALANAVIPDGGTVDDNVRGGAIKNAVEGISGGGI